MRGSATVVTEREPRLQQRLEPGGGVVGERVGPLATTILVFSVVMVPVQIPRGAGSVTPADLPIAAFLFIAGAVLWRQREPFHLPLAGSYFLILLGGLLAVTQSVAPQAAFVALLQDVYLFAWFLLLVNLVVVAGPLVARSLAFTWSVVGSSLGLGMWLLRLVFYPDKVPHVFGWPTVNVWGRSLGTFHDPNMAGNYLVVSLFVLWWSPRPNRGWVKGLLSIPILLGIHSTASITALVALVAGVVVSVVVGYFSRRKAAVAGMVLVVAASMLILSRLPEDFAEKPGDVARSLGDSEVFDESLGRVDSSAGPRVTRLKDSVELFGSKILLGIGPSATDETLAEFGAEVGGEIHNDYAAAFLERGLLGGAGLVILVSLVAGRSVQVAWNPVMRSGRPSALVGGSAAILVSGLTLETLHYRHAWLLFALIFALGLLKDDARGEIRPSKA